MWVVFSTTRSMRKWKTLPYTLNFLGFHMTQPKFNTEELSILLSFYFYELSVQLKTYILKNFHFEGVLRFVIEYAWTHTSTVTRIYLSRSLGLFFSSRRNRFYRIISCACHRVNQLTCGRNNHKNSWRDTSYLGKISVISPKIFFISLWSRRGLS